MTGTSIEFEVRPVIPEKLARLQELANDLLYSWDHQVRGLFYRLDHTLWTSCGHNPNVFLRRIAQQILEDAINDPDFMEEYSRVISAYDIYHKERMRSDIAQSLGSDQQLIAYFCAEFGFHESFPIYSGGLGILAGDHCKAASDLALPLVAVGLLYRQGYFTQTVDAHGHQVAHYSASNFEDLPVAPARDKNGSEIRIALEMPKRSIMLKVWEAKAGHVTLYLLDSDLPENTDSDRAITYQLYGGDAETRIQQEIVLGVGGVRALRSLGLYPTVWHINEGHAAFLTVERCREYISDGLDFASAFELAASATVFTTHTPVPAGHDIFTAELVHRYFHDLVIKLGIDDQTFMNLGDSPDSQGKFNMTALGLRSSRFHNGVSQIHAGVASKMEGYIWPQIPPDENPIDYVTNGVHVPTFLAREWINFFNMRFRGWRSKLLDEDYWSCVNTLADHRFWSLRQSLKTAMLGNVNQRLLRQYNRNDCSTGMLHRITRYTSQPEGDVLVVGFARRFAEYKRATLLFADKERLERLLNDPQRPVLLIFSGKAHPSDEPSQNLIRVIHEISQLPGFQGKVLVLEGYDMALARSLVTGVDVWLNTPKYPMEASGTSGQKAAINGVLNLSILDGWWGEAYNGENGWAIPCHDSIPDAQSRDQEEANELLDILEFDVIPLYFTRDHHGYPAEWVKYSKASMKSVIPRFNAQRMVMDYVTKFYIPASRQNAQLSADHATPAKKISIWKNKVRDRWPKVSMHRLKAAVTTLKYGEPLSIGVHVFLNGLSPEDVVVECLVGVNVENGEFKVQEQFSLSPEPEPRGPKVEFSLDLKPKRCGLQCYKLRIFPYHPLLSSRFETGCMIWL